MADRRRRRRRKLRHPILLTVTLSVILFSMIVIGIRLNQREELQEEIYEEEERMIESPFLYHSYDWSNLEKDGPFITYEDDNYYSVQGIDVSAHQKQIDWDLVRAQGIRFAMIRVGYRGYETGIIHKDKYFDRNIQEAQRLGIKVGVYFYSQAINPDEAREEADFLLDQIRGYDIDLPVVFDMEEADTGENGRILSLSREEKTECALTYLHRVQSAGYPVMLYNSTNLFDELFVMEDLAEFDLWVAEYASQPHYPYVFSMWQYTSSAEIEGITGGTDMDIMFILKHD